MADNRKVVRQFIAEVEDAVDSSIGQARVYAKDWVVDTFIPNIKSDHMAGKRSKVKRKVSNTLGKTLSPYVKQKGDILYVSVDSSFPYFWNLNEEHTVESSSSDYLFIPLKSKWKNARPYFDSGKFVSLKMKNRDGYVIKERDGSANSGAEALLLKEANIKKAAGFMDDAFSSNFDSLVSRVSDKLGKDIRKKL